MTLKVNKKGTNVDKSGLLSEIKSLTQSIDQLANKDSLATLDHKIKQRQLLIESLFNKYKDELSSNDIVVLKAIQHSTSGLLNKMESAKLNRGDEIIKHKSKGNRIRLYTSIAKQK
ncbi:MAG: hypothetical protein ACJAYK_001457 [Crocinitomicaceae bacterium]